jgi:hypothetical protein
MLKLNIENLIVILYHKIVIFKDILKIFAISYLLFSQTALLFGGKKRISFVFMLT